MTAVACPDENALVRFSAGQLSGTDLTALEQHLDHCSACRSLVAKLAGRASTAPMTDGTGPALARHTKIGRYQVEGLLGGGGMGVVYAARDAELNRVVALKLLRTTTAATPELRARLQREAQTMARLSHPNLVPVFELGSEGGDDFLAMELIDGPTLDLWLRDKKPHWKEVLRIFLEAGRGLEAAHNAGVVHRDFKPSNVLLGPDGRARVTDFGLARPDVTMTNAPSIPGSLELTREGSLMGTPAYMSPQQLDGKVADARSDQFSFCVALAEALTGTRPFVGDSIVVLRAVMQSRPSLQGIESPALQRTLARGLALDPDDRFPSMGALLDELAGLLKPPMSARRIAIGVALALVVGSIPLGWKAYTADPVREDGDYSAIRLRPNGRQGLTIPFVRRAQSADPKIAQVSIEGDRVLVVGLSAGRTTVTAFADQPPRADPRRIEIDVEVEAEPEPQILGHENDAYAIQLTPGSQMALTVPQTEGWKVDQPDLVDAEKLGFDQVLLTGRNSGRTKIAIWDKRGQTVEFKIRVQPRIIAVTIPPGGRKVLEVPGAAEYTLASESNVEAVREGDQITLRGKSVGQTMLEVTTTAGITSKFRVKVELPGAYVEVNTLHTFRTAVFKTWVLDLVRVKVDDPIIASATVERDEMLRVVAHQKGRTKLTAFASNGDKLLEWTVDVGDPPTAPEPTPPLREPLSPD